VEGVIPDAIRKKQLLKSGGVKGNSTCVGGITIEKGPRKVGSEVQEGENPTWGRGNSLTKEGRRGPHTNPSRDPGAGEQERSLIFFGLGERSQGGQWGTGWAR